MQHNNSYASLELILWNLEEESKESAILENDKKTSLLFVNYPENFGNLPREITELILKIKTVIQNKDTILRKLNFEAIIATKISQNNELIDNLHMQQNLKNNENKRMVEDFKKTIEFKQKMEDLQQKNEDEQNEKPRNNKCSIQ